MTTPTPETTPGEAMPRTFEEWKRTSPKYNQTAIGIDFAKAAYEAASVVSSSLEQENARLKDLLDLERQNNVACKHAVVYTVGGKVEGHPTQDINYLQRLRELVSKEAQLTAANEREAKLRELLKDFYGKCYRKECRAVSGMVNHSTCRECGEILKAFEDHTAAPAQEKEKGGDK